MDQTAQGAPGPDALFEELRLATVMTGGVSLAVWMGGVTAEMGRLLDQAPGYAELQRRLWTRCTLDVVSGTSAGGINGILLAFAQARQADTSVLRDVWLQEASLADILRSPREQDPLSLLRGDDKFLPALGAAMRRLGDSTRSNREDHSLSREARDRLQLFITATLLQGESRSTMDDFGTVVHDVDHKALFRFDNNDLLSDAKIPALALAARTTASFPGAFEASFVPVGDSKAPVDMDDHVDVTISRFAVDGGVLVNKPLGPAIQAIFEAPASQPVRRVLAYVVPDPGVSTWGEAERPDQPPTLQDVLMRSLLDIPHVQSVAADLDQITTHNKQVMAQREARVHLLKLAGEPLREGEVDADVARAYIKLRAEAEADELLDEMTRQLNGLLAQKRLPEEWKTDLLFNPEAFAQRRKTVTGQLSTALKNSWPGLGDFPGEQSTRTLVGLGRSSLDRAAAVCLDLVRHALQLTSDAPDRRETLCLVVAQMHRQLGELSSVPRARDVVAHHAGELSHNRANSSQRLDSWIDRVVKDWLKRSALSWHDPPTHGDDPAQAWQLLVTPLTEHAELFRRLADHADEDESDNGLYGSLASYLLGRAGAVEPGQVVTRLLRLAAYERVLAIRAPVTEQPARFIQISADSRNLLDENRKLASDKLTGLQLHHFGAFYKRSWRANDWMWGRIDGAGWLVHLLLSPDRLRSLQQQQGSDVVTWCTQFLADLKALSRTSGTDVRTVVDDLWAAPASNDDMRRTREQVATAELYAVFGWRPPSQPAGSAAGFDPDVVRPMSMPHTSMLVAAGLQIGIVLEEMPVLRQQLSLDAELGGGQRKSSSFRAEYDYELRTTGVLDARQAVKLLRHCTVADEKLEDEFGTDLMTYTAATAAATGVFAAGRMLGKAPVVLKPGVALVRIGTLGVYALARMALQRSKTAFAVLCLLMMLSVSGAVWGPGMWRNAGHGGLVIVGAYVALRLPRDARDGIRVALVVAAIIAILSLVIPPSGLPVQAWRDWPQDLLGWLGKNDGQWLRLSFGVVAMLFLAWIGSAVLSHRNRPGRALWSLQRDTRTAGQIVARRRLAVERSRSAAGSLALRFADWSGAAGTPTKVDATAFENRLAASLDRKAVRVVRDAISTLHGRGAQVEYTGTPAQPRVSLSWPGQADHSNSQLAVVVDCDARLVFEPGDDDPVEGIDAEPEQVRELTVSFGARRDGSRYVVDLTQVESSRTVDLIDLVVKIAGP